MMTYDHFEKIRASEQGRLRKAAQAKLVDALRVFESEQREDEAKAAIESLAKQEAREAKLKALAALSDDDLDKVQIG